MTMKLTLATVSLVALLTGVARADDNFANTEQSGSDNDGVVVQGPGHNNAFGRVVDAALQHGDGNRLEILQQGNFNEIGTREGGFEQRGDLNDATITQYSNRNVVGAVLQKGMGGGGADPRNTLAITQGDTFGNGGHNAIWRVKQVKRGDGGLAAGNDAELTQSGARNEIGGGAGGGVSQRGRKQLLTVTQSSDDNSIHDIGQRGRDNDATVRQEDGDHNSVGDIVQDGRHNTLALRQHGPRNNVYFVHQDGRGNDATLDFDGNNNGVGDFQGVLTGAAASLAGIGQGTVTQSLGANTLSYRVEGNRNRFGFAQEGVGNTIDGGVIGTLGNQNEIVGYQLGDGNDASFLQDGNGNETALGQSGSNNDATIDITGSFNLAGIAQLGNRNDANIDIGGNRNAVVVAQFQNKNHAQITVDGNRNFASVVQLHTAGSANWVTLDITGNDNNNPLYSGIHDFTDAALAAAGPLVPGAILQSGHGNTIDMTVGVTVASNANMFAFSQDGSGNGIVGIVDGTGNQAVVVQTGAGNFTSFIQSGNYNIIGVTQ
jgi:hypothetical protein